MSKAKASRLRKWLPKWWEWLIFVVLIIAIHYWQTKDTLSSTDGQSVPDFTLPTLTGDSFSSQEFYGKPTLYYFFAPWCSICDLSIENTQYLKSRLTEGKINIVTVALDYQSTQEVNQFLADKDLPGVILLGTNKQLTDFKIKGFPTYYITDDTNTIRWASVGYSTGIGLKAKMEWLLE